MGEEYEGTEDEEGMELEDLDEDSDEYTDNDNEQETSESGESESEQENERTEEEINPMPPAYLRKFAEKLDRAKELGTSVAEKAKGKGDEWFDSAMQTGTKFYDRHKTTLFSVYDKIMDLKDDMKSASKAAGGKWAGVKSAVGVLGSRIKGTEAYKKIAGSRFGKLASKGIQGIKTGASSLKSKVAGSKLGKWVSKKVAERKARPKKESFLKKAWSSVKTGASALKDKITGSKLGQWVSKKIAERKAKPKKDGFFKKIWGKVKSGAARLIDKAANTDTGKWIKSEWTKGKEWIGEQKKWLDEKKQRLLAFKERISDELDDHEHERRMALKARNGDADYEKRYNNYVEELKNNEGIQKILSKMSVSDIKSALNELESGKDSDSAKAGESGYRVGNAMNTLGGITKTDTAQEHLGKYIPKTGASYLPASLYGIGAMVNAGTSLKNARTFGRRAEDMDKLRSEAEDDSRLGTLVTAQHDLARRNQMEMRFDAAKRITTGATSIMKSIPAAKPFAKLGSAVGMGISIAGKAVTSGMEKKTTKMLLKEAVGGPEGYRRLKEKYRLQAQEMRRGMREAVGVKNDKNVADMEEGSLLDYAQEQAESENDKAQRVLEGVGEDAIRDIRRRSLTAGLSRKNYGRVERAM